MDSPDFDPTINDVSNLENRSNNPSTNVNSVITNECIETNSSNAEQRNECHLDVNSDSLISTILDHVQVCPAVFKNQQIGEPDLTDSDKRTLAEALLKEKPNGFLTRFGAFLTEEHLQYFLSSDTSEVAEHAKHLVDSLHHNKRLQLKNRRYAALKQLEEEGSYFSESEMEKREPLLYHQLVGQYLTEKEKIKRYRENKSGIIPTFSNFLIEKMERDEIVALRQSQQELEEKYEEEMSDDDSPQSVAKQNNGPRWGDDWIDAEKAAKGNNIKRPKKPQKVHLSKKEKSLLLNEFKSLMHTKFLNGLESEFDYESVDLNPEYDCLSTRAQDEEDKYFDDESCDTNVCTDTGIEDY